MTLCNIDKKLASQEDRIRTAKYSGSNKGLISKLVTFRPDIAGHRIRYEKRDFPDHLSKRKRFII